MTAISWLSVYLQIECEYDLMNEEFSSANVTPSHDDRCAKKRRRSISSISPKTFSDSEFLRTSVLTNVHRTPMFLQTFSTVVRVRPFDHSLVFIRFVFQLLDLCSLDIEYSQFPKNVLAATAILACKPNWPVEQFTCKKLNVRDHSPFSFSSSFDR